MMVKGIKARYGLSIPILIVDKDLLIKLGSLLCFNETHFHFPKLTNESLNPSISSFQRRTRRSRLQQGVVKVEALLF
jgi:hypothetical protein